METNATAEEIVLGTILHGLCQETEAIKIERTMDAMGVLLMVDIAKSDMGKVIGKEGHMAQAIRTVLHGVGMKGNARVTMKLREPAGSTHVHVEPVREPIASGAD